MPIYEYLCTDCLENRSVFFKTFEVISIPKCSNCGGINLERIISRVSIHKSWGSSLNKPDVAAMNGIDDSDTGSLQNQMLRLRHQMGDTSGKLSELDLIDTAGDPHSDST